MTDSTIKHIAAVFPIDAEALKPDPKFRRRLSIIREFGLNTTSHGIPSITRSQSIPNRIFWIVSTVAFAGIMLFFIVQSMISFFQYPTQTSVSTVVDRSQPFPAVSICNYSPIRFDTFIGPFLNYTNSLGLTNTTDNSTISAAQSTYIRNFVQYLFNNGYAAYLYNYSFPLESMLLFCSYNGQSCNTTDFISFLSSTYGVCYTFNAQLKSNQTGVRSVTDNGGTGILQLRLYAYSNQYVPYIVEDVSSGMVAMIHDNTELPLIEVAGIELAPGRRHKLSYKKSTHQLLPSPYSDCTNTIPLVMLTMFDQYEGADYAYSQVLCNTLCIQTYVYQECKCTDPLQWTARSIVLPGTNNIVVAPLCNITDPCYGNATSQISNNDSIWNEFCSNCSEACSTVDFTVTPSGVLAPSTIYTYMYKSLVENSGIALPTNWSTTWQTEFQNNYVAVDIVCETTLVESYTDSASIGGVDLLSNIGGLTGLWIGISFLSLMELVEMLYRLIRYHYYIIKRKRQHKTNETL